MTSIDPTFTTSFWFVVAITLLGAVGCFGYAELQLLSPKNAPSVVTEQ